MADPLYFFGCDHGSGHHLTPRPRGDERARRLEMYLDGNPMILPWPERVGIGALTYLPVIDMTALSWWGSPWDSRPGVNNSILLRGQHDADAVWNAFHKEFPALAAKLTRPAIVSTTTSRKA